MATVLETPTNPPTTNGTTSSETPLQLSLTLPSNPTTRLHLQLTTTPASLLLFLTTTTPETTSQPTPLGSFVHALPDRYNPTQPLSTPLYTIPQTLDFTTRVAKLLARKTGRAVYVASSVDLSQGVMGGNVEEEMVAFRKVVEVVVGRVGSG